MAALLGLGAFGALTAMFILVLAIWLDAWLACLIVTVVYAAGAAVLALYGKRSLKDASAAGAGADHRDAQGGRAMGADHI